jgi:transposase-like protein
MAVRRDLSRGKEPPVKIRTGKTLGAQARAESRWLSPSLPLVSDPNATLAEFVVDAGLEEFGRLVEEEVSKLAGPRGKKRPEREASRWGRRPARFPLGGRTITLEVQRVRRQTGGEMTLTSVARFQSGDVLAERVVKQILSNVSTRGYEGTLEPAPQGVKTAGASKSAANRRFVAATQARVKTELARSLEELSPVALFLDGINISGSSIIVAIGVEADGKKNVLGLRLGSTENAVLCADLLQELLGRGLHVDGPILCVIDGGKGLRKAITDVFGDRAVLQRCQLHKMRNVETYLPRAKRVYALGQMRKAYKAQTPSTARKLLAQLASWLERDGHEDAAGSVREGLEETLTALKLNLGGTLTRSFSTTNAVENVMSSIRRTTRNVKRWRNPSMIRRWVGLSILQAQKKFRRIKGHSQLRILVAALARLRPNPAVSETAVA